MLNKYLFATTVIVVILCFGYVYLHENNAVIDPGKQQVGEPKNVFYRNEVVGFEILHGPESGKLHGLSVQEEPATWYGAGAVNFIIMVPFRDTVFQKDRSDGWIGTFSAVPVAEYEPIDCTGVEYPCLEPNEVGRNSKYVFLSDGGPTDLFADCTNLIEDESKIRPIQVEFTNANPEVCTYGPTLRMIERDRDLFKIFEPTK